jgi:hypothetical protein
VETEKENTRVTRGDINDADDNIREHPSTDVNVHGIVKGWNLLTT